MRRSQRLTPDVAAKLQFLLKSQYWDPEQLHRYQWTRLQCMLQHAARHVPWYRQQFATIGFSPEDATGPADLKKLPELTRDLLRSAGDQLLAETANRSQLLPNYSGGSTGEPVRVYQDAEYQTWATAARIRAWKNMVGAQRTDREALLWGADRDVVGQLSCREVLRSGLQGERIQLNTFCADVSAYRRFIRILRLLRPKLLRGYTSSLRTLCEIIETDHTHLPPLRAVIACAETLHESERKRFERAFSAPVLNSYGCREVSQIATECPCQQGLHISMETNYVEIVDGRVLVTNMTNYAMPLIRYVIGDLADTIEAAACTCGRGLMRITRLRGRVSDTLCFGQRRIHAERIAHLLYGTEAIGRFQIVKNEPCNRLTILVDRDDPACRARLLDDLHTLLPGTRIQVKTSNQFFQTRTGKQALVIDEPQQPATPMVSGRPL